MPNITLDRWKKLWYDHFTKELKVLPRLCSREGLPFFPGLLFHASCLVGRSFPSVFNKRARLLDINGIVSRTIHKI